MKYNEWMKLIRKHPCKDLNGKVIAYDIDGTPLGEVIFKDGKVISRGVYSIEKVLVTINKEVRGDETTGGFVDC